MLDAFYATLTPMLVLFCCMVIGFVLRRKLIVPDNTGTVISKLENNILVPALIIKTFMNNCTVETIKEHYDLIFYSALFLTVAISLAIPLSKLFFKTDAYKRNIYKYALAFGNFGFIGNAITLAIFGEEMLYKYMLFVIPMQLVIFTWGRSILIPKGAEKESLIKHLVNPSVVSILIGIFLGLTGITKHIPAFLTTTVSNLAACMSPLAMVLTGVVVGGYPAKELLKDTKVYIASVLRLIIIPLLLLGLGLLIRANETVLICILFAYAAPLGLYTVIFPAAYGGDTRPGAAMAMISNSACVITIPVMYSLLVLLR